MKAVVAAFNQEKALVGAFSVITILRMDLFEALVDLSTALQHMTDNIILILCCVECKCLTTIKIALLLFEEI